MEINRHSLPEDPAVLQQMVTSLLEELETKERRLRQLQHWVEQLLRWRYGPRRERVNENQLFLFAIALVSAAQQTPTERDSSAGSEEAPTGSPQCKGHGRKRLPKNLERRRVVYDLAERERHCPDCRGN
jgi:hypothetical protein